MKVRLVLPHFITSKTNNNSNEIFIVAKNFGDIADELESNYSEISKYLFEGKNLRRNVIVVVNDELVDKRRLKEIHFQDKTEIEFLLQLAGG